MRLLLMLVVSLPMTLLASGGGEARDCDGPGSYYPRGDLWPS